MRLVEEQRDCRGGSNEAGHEHTGGPSEARTPWLLGVSHGGDEPGDLGSLLFSLTSVRTQASGAEGGLGACRHRGRWHAHRQGGSTLYRVQGARLHVEVMTLRILELHIQTCLSFPSLLIIIALSLLSCPANYEMRRLDLRILDLK